MEVQLLVSERERTPTLTERDRLHTEHALIELEGPPEIRDGEDDVVDP
jgi:hypothetical protein